MTGLLHPTRTRIQTETRNQRCSHTKETARPIKRSNLTTEGTACTTAKSVRALFAVMRLCLYIETLNSTDIGHPDKSPRVACTAGLILRHWFEAVSGTGHESCKSRGLGAELREWVEIRRVPHAESRRCVKQSTRKPTCSNHTYDYHL